MNNVFLSNIVAFHCQQTVEKCFKAIIEEKNMGLKRIHSLYNLFSIIKNHIAFEIVIDQLELLDEVYTTSRYPGEAVLIPQGKPTKDETQHMYEFAKYIYDKTLEMLEN